MPIMFCAERRSPGFRGGKDLWQCPACHRRLLVSAPSNLRIGEKLAVGEVPPTCDCDQIIGGVYNGMTEAEVIAARDAYNRLF